MTGKFYLDKVDAYEAYGVYLTEGSYKNLIAWPAMKTVNSNDWHEENGIEPDLAGPVLDTRNISLSFAIAGDRTRLEDFISAMTVSAYHDFYIEELGHEWRLRMTSHSSLDTAPGLQMLNISFADDFPLKDYEYTAPHSLIEPHEDYLLDGRKLTDYGVRILEGTLAGLMKRPSVKTNLLRNIKSLKGAIYDGLGDVVLQSKDVTLNFLLRADSTEEMWHNYNALLYDFVRPGERTLSCSELGNVFPFYYKSSSVSEFAVSGKIWLKFSLTLCIFKGQ